MSEAVKIAGAPIERAADRPLFVNMLVYGTPGVGKTLLAATAEDVDEMRPVLFLDMEGGMESFRHRFPDIHTIRIKDQVNDQGVITKMAWKVFSDIYEELKTGKHLYKTVVVDSLTEAYDLGKKWWLNEVRKTKPDRDPDMPAERDWVKQGAQFRHMIKLFRDLDMHVIFTALKGEVTKKEGDSIRVINYTPSVPGKLAYAVAAEPDIVAYLWAEEPSKKQQDEGKEESKGIRKLLSQPLNKFICKDRYDVLPTVMQSPTMAEIFRLVTEGGDTK